AMAQPWAKDESQFFKINVEGTRLVLQSALDAKINRVVFVSTAGVFGPSGHDDAITEASPMPTQLGTSYEQSKRECESVVQKYQNRGLDVLSVYPTRVFGPGRLSSSNSITKVIKQVADKSWKFIPGDGSAIGNYVFVDDLVDGLMQCFLNPSPSPKYLLGGENLNFHDFFEAIQSAVGDHRKLIRIPYWVIRAKAYWEMTKTFFTKRPPEITPAFVTKYSRDYKIDCSRAIQELDYRPRNFADGLRRTVDWLNSRN
ncbi:MAG: NAD-dependent epimerase/dehydratase family protein, partial [Planctomycetota bacterium]